MSGPRAVPRPATRPRAQVVVMLLLRDPAIRTAVMTLLHEQRYSVRVVDTPAEAIEYADRDEPAAVILDAAEGWPAARLLARSLRFLRATQRVPILALAREPTDDSGDITGVLTAPFTGLEILAFLPWPDAWEAGSEWSWNGAA